MTDTLAATRLAPLEIAPETFVIHGIHGEGEGPLAVHMNAMLIRGAEPVVVDTGVPGDRTAYLDDLFSLVEPQDVRWVFLSHDDVDHYGNLMAVLSACPNATLVANWFLTQRLPIETSAVPPDRWRWVNDGEAFHVGDRTLVAIRPPLYDSPTTRGLFDPKTGVYWASDCYATPVPSATPVVGDLDPHSWREGFGMFQAWNSPWVSMLDAGQFGRACDSIERLGVTTIATAHGPTITGSDVARAHAMLRAMPDTVVPPQPGQLVLDEIVAALTAASQELTS